MGRTVMVIGLGAVGQWVVEFLARRQGVDRIFTADVNEEVGVYRTNSAAISSILEGHDKKFEFRKVDLNDVEVTSRLLERLKPAVIFASVTLNSWWILQPIPIPDDVYRRFSEAGFSVLLPWHLPLMSKLMQAVAKSGIDTHVINSSFPDVVGPVLWRYHGLGPTVGIGNHDLMAAEIIKRVSDAENVPVRDVTLYFVGSHALGSYGSGAGVPFFAKVMIGDRNVTSKFDILSWTQNRLTGFSSKVGRELHLYSYTAASAVKNIMAILNDTNEFTHAPSPNGLPGGYPVRLSAKGAKVDLPEELTLEEAVRMNEQAAKWEGIEKIKDDGTVVYTDKTYAIMREYGYDCKELCFDDLEPRAKELNSLVSKLLEIP